MKNVFQWVGKRPTPILDQIDINSPLPLAADLVIAFIERNISKEGHIGCIQRTDVFQYPPVSYPGSCDTDYAMTGGHIQVAIFNDRIEFTNPGGLPFGQTIERALAGSSRIRNRVIARVFRELNLTEQWGSGLRRIVEACKTQGLKPPLIEELNNQFRLTLYSEQIKEIVVNSWEEVLLEYLKKENAISAKSAMKLWGVSARTTRIRLKQLQEKGIIVRIGT